MSSKIFYSWQSDLANRTNRGFIQNALERAVKTIRLDKSIEVEPVIDRDTLGEPGAPDIASTIFRKIDSSSGFVCDVSIVSKLKSGRAYPNPNVLIELGYALKSLHSERVVLVFNTAYGEVNDLPFDLRFKRVLTYNMSEKDEPSTTRNMLASSLEIALRAIFEHIEQESKDKDNSEYISSLNKTLIQIILFGEESRERKIDPWDQEVIDKFKYSAEQIRDHIANEIATELDITYDLEILADNLDEAVDYPQGIGRECWDQYHSLVDKAVNKAWEIKSSHIDIRPIDDASRSQIKEFLNQRLLKLQQWISRYDRSRSKEGVSHRLVPDLMSNVSSIGYELLQLSYYKLDEIEPKLSDTLRREAQPLHLMDYKYEIGDGYSEQLLIDEIRKRLSSIQAFVDGHLLLI